MDPRLRPRIEIETIHELLGQLTHYQLLAVKPEVPQVEIDNAFRNESRRLHPDRHAAGATPDQKAKANDVFKAINEAYRVLRDPDSRAAYDAGLKGGGQKAADEKKQADAAAKDPSKAARTAKGEKFWKLALQSWNEENFGACVMNIDFALSFEADNEVFKEWRVKAKALADEQKKGQQGNTYKIRL